MGAACTKGIKKRATVFPSAPAREQPPSAGRPGLQHSPPTGHKDRRRGSVSAEPGGGPARSTERQSVIKPEPSANKIRELVRSTLLFKELDEEQEAQIIDAMFERRVAAREVVIREGDEADNFYVIESGTFVATKATGHSPSLNVTSSAAERKSFAGRGRGSNAAAAAGSGAGSGPTAGATTVAQYEGKGAFGELALMYNCPRAATVTALTDGVLWGVDRATFRSLVVASMEERRQRYETALHRMPILQHLTPAQLAAVADCLHSESFEPGEYILWEGAPLDASAKFYMIESGRVDCFRTFEGKKKAVGSLQAGDVFGEVALLTKAPRQADCVAATQCKCLAMSRDAFERLMGPAEDVLSQQIAAYAKSNKEQEQEAAKALEAATDASSHAAAQYCATPDAGGIKGAAQASCCTPPPQPAPGSPAGSSGASFSTAALLPGSPRPPLSLSESSFSKRRSHRSMRSSASSEAEPGSSSSSPTSQHALADGSSGAAGAQGSPAGPQGPAGNEAGEEPAICTLPSIAEEPAEPATAAMRRLAEKRAVGTPPAAGKQAGGKPAAPGGSPAGRGSRPGSRTSK